MSDRPTDIVAGGFDAGIRFGRHLEQDMVAVPLGPDMRTLIVSTAACFDRRSIPKDPCDLSGHRCLNYRTAGHGDLQRWGPERDGRPLDVAVPGPIVVNDGTALIDAALAGSALRWS